MIFSKNEQEFIIERMRYVGVEVYAATEHFVTCKGASWAPYAVAVAKRANAAVEAFLKDNGDRYIPEEMILAANFLMP